MLELKDLENRSIYIIREAYAEFRNIAALWSTGKDSTTVLWLCYKAFFGRIPFPVIHIDTGRKFREMYEFRDRLAREWGFELLVARNEEAMREGMGPEKGKFECCTKLKTEALRMCLEEHGFDALILAIRRDEHGIRAKERYFCFPKGTLVYGEDVKPIEEIKPGDLVYTHLGSLRRVRGVSSRPYQGDLISITPRYGLPILMTPNHVLLAKVRVKGKGRIIWVRASELKPGDRVFIPKLAKKPQDHHNAPDFIPLGQIIGDQPSFRKNKKKTWWNSAHKSSPKIRASFPVTPDMLRVIGYYVAEGSANPSANQLEFGFGAHERSLAEDVIKVINTHFGVKGAMKERGAAIRVSFSSKTLMLLFQSLCGNGSRDRKLPSFFTRLTKKQLLELVKGCWLGDGRMEKYSTTSWLLAHQLRMAMLRLGLLTSIKKHKDGRHWLSVVGLSKAKFEDLFGFKSEVPYIGRCAEVKEVGELHSTSLSCSDYGKSKCGGFWVPIEKIEVVPYSGLVYDLNVEGDSSYLVQGIAVHNSPRDENFRWDYQDQPLEMWDQFQGLVRQGTHMRVHPILHWRELDVWEYIKKEGIPINPMYFARDGKRYRSLGCEPCTLPIDSNASTIDEIVEELRTTKIAERAGRAQDKERIFTMQKLRALGYM